MCFVRVLIVDDSKVMRSAVVRVMRQAGYEFEFEQAGDGKEALEKLPTFKPDLILSDWNMPTMNGIMLLRQLRTDGNRIRFGFITSRSTLGSKEEALRAGAQFFIFKPFSADDFIEALGPPPQK